MALIVTRLARYAARRIAANPKAREFAARTARDIADEAKTVAKEDDKARAAGRAVRRLVKGLSNPAERRTAPDSDDPN